MEHFRVTRDDFELLKNNATSLNMSLVKASNYSKDCMTLAISAGGDIAYCVDGDDQIKHVCDYSRAFIQADELRILYIDWIDGKIFASITPMD